MTAEFEEMLRAKTRIRKLMGLAAGNANESESKSAMAMAQRLAQKHGIDMTTLRPMTAAELGAPEDKLAAMRRMMAAFGPAISKAHPGVDEKALEAERRKDDLYGRK